MTRILLFMSLCFLPVTTVGQVSVRIFARTRPVTIVFTPLMGEYLLDDGSGESLKIIANETVAVTKYDEMVIYRTLSGEMAAADSLLLSPLSEGGLFTIRAPGRGEEKKKLNGSLKIRSYPGSLQVINTTSIDTYLPGVVKAEAGRNGPGEYFRAQAVVARTYTYRNIDRHLLDGFNLCDDTHCQVYPGIIEDSLIINACRVTTGKVIVDKDTILIESAFHANCGGVTAASADVWVANYPYLISVNDPWCRSSKSSVWRAGIAVGEWKEFLRSKDVLSGREAALYSPAGNPPSRVAGFTLGSTYISKEEIRKRFGLRSSFYSLSQSADSIIISGRGYGHGVGLCQDGARAMAASGKKYEMITGFYYPGTAVIDIKNAHRPARP